MRRGLLVSGRSGLVQSCLSCLPNSSEKEMATHSSTLAWRIQWTEEPGGLQSMGSLRVGHDWATSLWLFTFMHWRRKWQPTPVFLPGESQGFWWAAVYGVSQSRTRLKRFSSSLIARLLASWGAWGERKAVIGREGQKEKRKVGWREEEDISNRRPVAEITWV